MKLKAKNDITPWIKAGEIHSAELVAKPNTNITAIWPMPVEVFAVIYIPNHGWTCYPITSFEPA